MRLLGSRVVRREDRRLLTTGGRYVADVHDRLLHGAVHLAFVRSPLAHGRIVDVDLGPARSTPGVIGAFTATDLDIGVLPPVLPHFDPALGVPALATDRVRYVGEPVAVVAATDAATAADAVERVELELEPLPPVVGIDAALADAVVVHPGRPGTAADTNTVARYEVGHDSDGLLAGCEVVVRATLWHQRTAACPLETRAAASAWDDTGRLHHWLSVQAPHAARMTLEAVFGLEAGAVRVIAPDVGGGFGPKFGCYPEDVVTAWVARTLGRPARWAETRAESMTGLHHGRAQRHEVVLGGTRDGRLVAYGLDVVADAGAYASLGVYVPEATCG